MTNTMADDAQVLRSPSGSARAAATRTLGHWGTSVKEGVKLLQEKPRPNHSL